MWRLALMILLSAVMLSPLLSIPFPAWAQAPPVPPPTCEVQLTEAQAQNIHLRKRAAQAEFTAAAWEEIATGLKKRVDELTPKVPADTKEPVKK